MFMPESPRWLVQVNQAEKATAKLMALKNRSEIDEAINTEIAQIESSLENARQERTSLMSIFSKNKEKLGYRFFLCIFLQFVQQMCGGNLISTYASTIFHDNLSLGVSLSKILAACALTWKYLSCFVSYIAIDRWGRRAVFMISGAGMSMSSIPIVVVFFYPETMNRNLEALNNTFVEASTVFEVVSMARKMPTQEIEDGSFDGSAQDGKKNLEEKEYA
ncbi:hypothetical protein NW764_012412 [Fusarium oxysporum]|nr:hypothetical protein NW764_012412 [Fusarium oxysporum]